MFITLRNRINPDFLFSPDGDDGGNDDNGITDAVTKAFEKLVARKGGDSNAVALMLFDENKRYRDTINDLRGKVPAEGAVVLAGADAQAYEAYKALGKPEEVKAAIEKRDQLQGQLDDVTRDATIRDAAAAAGFKFSVLSERDKVARKVDGKTLMFAVREVERDGKRSNVAFVKDGDTEKPLSEYAAEKWADYMPALVQGNQSSNGKQFPTQHTGTGGNQQEADVVSSFLGKREEAAKAATNPLIKK